MARLPRLMGRGRALEVLLGADDIPGELAERYGYVNRSFPDAELDVFVDSLATGSHRSTSRRSAKPSASPTSPVYRRTTKSHRSGTCALHRLCGRRRRRGSRC